MRPERAASILALLLAVICAACSGTPAPPPVAPDPTLARAEAVEARTRAPELWARAEVAAERARGAADDEAAADYLTESRLWRQAAIAEAERQQAEAQQAAVRARAEQRERELRAMQAERTQVVGEAERLAAGRLALEEVARVLALAESEPRRRPSLDGEALVRGTRALIDRASLVHAAARELGADAGVLAGVESRLARARALLERQPAEALREADRALFDAQAALGPVRGAGVDAATRQGLVDALRVAGLDPRRGDRGLTARVVAPSAGGRLPTRGLQRLCKLREAFPAGHWQLVLRDPNNAGTKRHAQALQRQLGALGCEAEPVEVASAEGLAQPTLEVSFLAY